MNISAQATELAIAYALAAGGMFGGLLLMGAGRRAYFRWPFYSVVAMALGVVSWNLLRRHVFPAEWVITHHAFIYYGALAIYVVMGFALGLLMGRLTRRAPREPEADPFGR